MKVTYLRAFLFTLFTTVGLLQAAEQSLIDQLINAIEFRQTDQVATLINDLLEAGESLNTRSSHGFYPLHHAATLYATAGDNVEIINLLLKGRASPTLPDNQGELPIHLAALMDNTPAVIALLDAGTEVNAQDLGGYTPFLIAAIRGNFPLAKLLIERGANIHIPNNFGGTPLKVLRRKNPIGAETLKGIYNKVQAALAENLFSAIEKEDEEEVKAVLLAGANVNTRDNERNTPLHQAILQGSVRLVELLIKKGANVNAKNKERFTPLHYAAYIGDPDIIQKLFNEPFINIVAQEVTGSIPLHVASLMGHKKAVELLLNRGNRYQVHTPNNRGFLPLHYAVRYNNYTIASEIAKLLMWAGANINAINLENQTPLDIAQATHGEKLTKELQDEDERLREEESISPIWRLQGIPKGPETQERKVPSALIPYVPATKLYTEGFPEDQEGKVKEEKDIKVKKEE